ncbi:MAG: VIT domain-containing protein, partial [Dehalococcoidia bacterium]|nr:VIT domain-containing protein [Dehalococcoidia bacterium]
MKKMLKLTIFIYTVCLFSSQSLASEVISQDIKLGDVREGMLLQRTEEPNFYNILPKLKTNVTIDVEGMVSSTTVGQLFTNDSDEPIEAIYVFPLPPDAAVHDMTMVVNNRLIKGIIQEKQKAKETYEKAKKEGKRTALTEQERPNIFTNSVANVMPGDTIL